MTVGSEASGERAGGALQGLRVVDVTDDSGRFATKLLAEAGADVVRVGRRGSPGAEMAEAAAAGRGGVLDWWYDGGKTLVELDLDTSEGRDGYLELCRRADLVIETEPPGRLASLGIDHPDLVDANPRLVQVSLTPFGRTGLRVDWQTSDLVAAALGGVLSVTGLPDQPLNSFGRQSFHFGGFMAALCGLAGVHAARLSGVGQLCDVSLHETVASSIENIFMQYLYDDLLPIPKVAKRQGSLHWLGAYVVVPAAEGNEMITVTPDYESLFRWMGENGFDMEKYFVDDVMELVANMAEVMDAVTRFAATKPAGELFTEAQSRHVAFGEVQTPAQIAENPQYEFRGLFGDVAWDGPQVRMPARLARMSGTPAPPPAPPAAEPAPLVTVAERWPASEGGPAVGSTGPAATAQAPTAGPLDGVRVLDLTWVLAGPFGTRLLGDLGADVLKLQTVERATSVNDPEHPYYPVWNRSKRSITLNMKAPGALDVARSLVEQADVLIENYSAGVVTGWGLGYPEVRSWNPSIVYVSMSGCGHEGPWKDIISYAPTIHALCGLTYLTNPPDRGDIGLGFSLNDHAAGFAAALLSLEALEARRRTGEGQYVDLAQLEVGTYLLGPTMLDLLSNGREATPAGNADTLGGQVPNEVYRAADDRWVAVTCRDDDDWTRLCAVTGIESEPAWASAAGRQAARAAVDAAMGRWLSGRTATEAVDALQGAGVPAGDVQDSEDLAEHDPQLRARGFWHTMDHALFGQRGHDGFPARWSTSELEPYRPSPYLGEHNFEVFGDLLGWDPERIATAIGDGLLQ